jgi:hypothetical protein
MVDQLQSKSDGEMKEGDMMGVLQLSKGVNS